MLWTPLKAAVYLGDKEVIELLLWMGADINRSTRRDSPLMLAAIEERIEIVKLLVRNGADVNFKVPYCQVPSQASPTKEETCYTTALIQAVRWNNTSAIANYLLKQGADVNAKDAFTPLMYAQSETCLQLLLDHRPNLYLKNIHGSDAIQHAIICHKQMHFHMMITHPNSLEERYELAKSTLRWVQFYFGKTRLEEKKWFVEYLQNAIAKHKTRQAYIKKTFFSKSSKEIGLKRKCVLGLQSNVKATVFKSNVNVPTFKSRVTVPAFKGSVTVPAFKGSVTVPVSKSSVQEGRRHFCTAFRMHSRPCLRPNLRPNMPPNLQLNLLASPLQSILTLGKKVAK